MARHQRAAAIHDGCGHPHEVCSDPAKKWYPQRTVCYPTMEREAASARYARLHEKLPWHDGTFTDWVAEPDDAHPYSFGMGVTVWIASKDYSPDDQFLVGAGRDNEPSDRDGESQDG